MSALEYKESQRARSRLLKMVKERFLVRFHMTIIIFACLAAGLLSTKVMLLAHIDSMMIRYPLVVTAAYLTFFAGVRIWLWYANQTNLLVENDSVVTSTRGGAKSKDKADDSSAVTIDEYIHVISPSDVLDIAPDISGTADTVGSGAETGGDIISGVGDAVSSTDSPFLLFAGIIVTAVVAVLLGSAVYVIYQAPNILSEAAFEFLLAAGMLKPIRRMDSPGWFGSVFKSTALPFIVITCLSILFAWAASSYAPEATKLSEVFVHSVGNR